MQNKDPLKFYSTAQVAGLAGVHKDTLLRWLRVGLVNEPDRDRRGWRTFSQSAAAEVVLVAKSPKTVRKQVENDKVNVYVDHATFFVVFLSLFGGLNSMTKNAHFHSPFTNKI